jgi:hypothetical protein
VNTNTDVIFGSKYDFVLNMYDSNLILNLDISRSCNTNEDDSHVTDLNMNKDHDAANQCDTFEDDSLVAPSLCMIFSDNGVDTNEDTLSRSPLIDAGCRIAIYFQNNRLWTKTTDLFKAVLFG